MTDPFAHDDPWKDLARDLGVEDATQPAAKPPQPAATRDDPEAEPVGEERPARGFAHRPLEVSTEAEDSTPPDIVAEAFTDAVDSDLEDGDEADGETAEGEPTGEESPPGEGQPGTGRKRRRRRRRRKKGGAVEGGEGAPTAEAEPASELTGDSEASVSATDEEFAEGEADEEAEEVGAESVSLAAEEDTGSDVLRDLIATWNVPSWDDIVASLYRPER